MVAAFGRRLLDNILAEGETDMEHFLAAFVGALAALAILRAWDRGRR